MAILTEQIKASAVTLNDFVHIARADNVQSDNGSSYKATISQLIDAESCCLDSGEYIQSANTINLYGLSDTLSLQIQNVNIFSGGSASCINNFYLNQIIPCIDNINIHPVSVNNRRTYFGSNNGASGFTVFHTIVQNNPASGGIPFTYTKLMLNTNTIIDSTSFSLLSKDKKSGWYFYDNFNSSSLSNFIDIQEPIINSPSDSNSTAMAIITPGSDSNNKVGGVMGIVGQFDNTLGYYGQPSDSFLSTTTHSNGLNIVSTDVETDDSGFIRFYLGCDYTLCDEQPHIHIDGDTGTKGFIGFGRNNINPTSLVDINGANANNNVVGFRNFRLRTSYTPPNQFDITIPPGTISWDDTGIYIKVNSAAWRKLPMSTF
jgi:hypothetical protein